MSVLDTRYLWWKCFFRLLFFEKPSYVFLIFSFRHPSLFLIPSAQTCDKTAVTPQQMKKLTDELREDFDYILFRARAHPTFAVVVVLPTPPFPDVITITSHIIRILLIYESQTITINLLYKAPLWHVRHGHALSCDQRQLPSQAGAYQRQAPSDPFSDTFRTNLW